MVRFSFAVGGNTNVIVRQFWSYTGTPPDDAAATIIAARFHAAASGNFPAVMNQDNSVTAVTVIDLSTAAGGEGTATGDTAGSLTGDPLSAGTALLQSFKIGRRYRGGKPRSYWPFGDSTSLLTPTAWQTAFVSSCTTQLDGYALYVEGFVTGGTTVGVQYNIGYYQGFVYTAPDPITHRIKLKPVALLVPNQDPILSYGIDPRPASQRRRNLNT